MIDDLHFAKEGGFANCLELYNVCFTLINIQFKALLFDPLNPKSIFSFVKFTLIPVFCKIQYLNLDHKGKLD